jgi:hypothetical protein
VEAPAQLDETSLFEGGLRGVFKSILKLFFLNPRPLVDAINAHATATADIVRREAERNRQQLEWNALHFELLKRLVTEVSRASLESQGLGLRVESLATKVDFNERRVRGLEGTVHDATAKAVSMPPPTRSGDDVVPAPSTGGDAAGLGDAQRRKRRRRRGRRGNMPGEFTPGAAPGPAGADAVPPLEDDDAGFDEGIGEDAIAPGAESNAPPASPAPEPREAATPTEPAEPPTTRWTQVTGPPPAVTPQVSTSDAPSVAPSPEPHSDESVQG